MNGIKDPNPCSSESEGRSAAATDQSKAFALLAVAALLRSIGPGAANYWQTQHILSDSTRPNTWSHLASQTSLVTSVFLLLVCLRTLTRFPPSAIVLTRATLLLTASLSLYFFRVQDVANLGWRSYLDLGSLIAVIVSVSALQPRLRDFRVIGVIGVTVAVYSIVFGVIRPSNAFMIDPEGPAGLPGKAIIHGRLLAGPTAHSNTLGIFLALCTPWVLLFNRRSTIAAGLGIMMYALLATASRTALIACGVALVLALFWHLPTPRGRIVKAYLALGLSMLFCAAVPLLKAGGDAFSGRGEVWYRSLEAWKSQGSPLIGLGPYWSPDGRLNVADWYPATSSSGHSLLIQWLVTGGVVQLVLGGFLFVSLIRRAQNRDRIEKWPVRCAYLASLLIISTTEFILVPDVSAQLLVPTIVVLAAIAAPPTEQEIRASRRLAQRPTRRGSDIGMRRRPVVRRDGRSSRRPFSGLRR